VIICLTYTAVSTILFLRNGAVTLLRMCIEWTNSFVNNLSAPEPVPAVFAWDACQWKEDLIIESCCRNEGQAIFTRS